MNRYETPAVRAVLNILRHPSVDVEAFPNPLAVYVDRAFDEMLQTKADVITPELREALDDMERSKWTAARMERILREWKSIKNYHAQKMVSG